MTQHVQLTVDVGEFAVKKRRKTATSDFWEDHLRLLWPDVKTIAFAIDRHDPIVALYAWTTSGRRYHVADSGFLSQSEWTELGNLISRATFGRLTLDLAGRDDPRHIWPDWLSGNFSHDDEFVRRRGTSSWGVLPVSVGAAFQSPASAAFGAQRPEFPRPGDHQ